MSWSWVLILHGHFLQFIFSVFAVKFCGNPELFSYGMQHNTGLPRLWLAMTKIVNFLIAITFLCDLSYIWRGLMVL